MAKIDLSKRSKAEKLCYDVFSALDPTGVNTKKYRDLFSNMTDTEFVKLMTNMIEDDTLNFVLDVVDFERDADLVKAKKAADILNIPLEEYAIMPFVNGNKDNPTITKEKVFVGYIIEKRLQQTTQKKNGISINIADRSPTTGQVVNHDKNGRSSDQENMALFATGAINAATEFNGFRADGIQRKNQAYSSITQKGYCTLEELDAGIEDRTILNTIDVLYTGMSIKTDLVNNDYMLIDTMKKIKQKTAATKESVEVEDEECQTVTEGILSKTPSMLINKKDIQLNLDKWGTAPEYNVLFITGFSGSGKSTLSKEYAGPNVHVFELDAYTANTQPIPKDEFYNYMVSNVPDINMLLDVKKTGKLLPTYKYSQILVNVIGSMLQFAEMNYPKKKFIIEGIQLYRDVPTDYVYGRPLIIKGTSGINSIVNRLKRDGDKYEYKSIFDYLNWYTLDTKRMNILYDTITTEGILNDVVNGVNPYSNKLFFHVSKDSKLNGKTLKPRIPSWITESIKKHGKKKFDDMMKFNGLYEDYTIPRVCFSSSIEGSINATIPGSSIITAAKDGALSGVYYVYIPEKPINEYKHIKNKDVVDNGYVYDANITREMWVLEPVKLELYGVIQVESVRNVKPVKNDNLTKKLDKPIYNYKNDIKWKWKIHPTVIDKYYSLNLYNQ